MNAPPSGIVAVYRHERALFPRDVVGNNTNQPVAATCGALVEDQSRLCLRCVIVSDSSGEDQRFAARGRAQVDDLRRVGQRKQFRNGH